MMIAWMETLHLLSPLLAGAPTKTMGITENDYVGIRFLLVHLGAGRWGVYWQDVLSWW